jgi:hypothetical protein
MALVSGVGIGKDRRTLSARIGVPTPDRGIPTKSFVGKHKNGAMKASRRLLFKFSA